MPKVPKTQPVQPPSTAPKPVQSPWGQPKVRSQAERNERGRASQRRTSDRGQDQPRSPLLDVPLFSLARRMGTSVEQIDNTYGHLLPDAVEYERGLLDAFDTRGNEAAAAEK
jgi:hypothetical protein